MSTVEKAVCKPAVFPYFTDKDPEVLALIYRRLASQDLLADLLHERVCSEEEFVKYVDEQTLCYLMMDLNSKEYVGIAWVAQTEQGECLKKGCGSFAFFREFHDMHLTTVYGQMVLSHWLNLLEYDVIWGLTPSTNRAAKRYCERVGLKYKATLPNFTSRRGEICDALICSITREELNASLPAETEVSGG